MDPKKVQQFLVEMNNGPKLNISLTTNIYVEKIILLKGSMVMTPFRRPSSPNGVNNENFRRPC